MALANGHNIIMAMLINRLAAAGQIDQLEFATLLRQTGEAARQADPTIPANRLDILMLRNLADILERETGWNPVVIDGGKPPEER